MATKVDTIPEYIDNFIENPHVNNSVCISRINNKIEPMISTLITTINNKLTEDEIYKCVMCLYTLCNKMYGDNQIPSKYLSDIKQLTNTKYMKVKFKLLDIIERR